MIRESSGSFTTEQLDREFCLTTRREKNARSKALNVYAEKKKIKKDKIRRGIWHVIAEETSFFSVQTALGKPFELNLFLGLTGRVFIPQKSIIVLAGMSNAGKTLLALELAKNNLSMLYRIAYFMPEMGPGLYRRRWCRERWRHLEAIFLHRAAHAHIRY